MNGLKLYKTYKKAGVDTKGEEIALKRIIEICHSTYGLRRSKIGESVLPIKHFAGIVKITPELGIAIKTDGVGTKVLIAQMMDEYDTIGIDCIAMNVNDIICVGAEPTTFVDYIAIERVDAEMLEEIAKGLARGAEMAKVAIVGGEIAQLPEIIRGKGTGKGLDLSGACIGAVSLDKIVKGDDLKEGDVVLGLRSSGIHSNGLTLARKVLLKDADLKIDAYIDKLDRTLGEELLEPTHIYVPEVLRMLEEGLDVKVLAHITGDGLLNLNRVAEGFGYVIEDLPKPQPIFELIQEYGGIADEEMYRVFNMGVGFCVVLPREEIDDACQIADKHKVESFVMGYATKDPLERVVLKPVGLERTGVKFRKL